MTKQELLYTLQEELSQHPSQELLDCQAAVDRITTRAFQKFWKALDPDETVTNTYGLNSGDRVFIIVNLSAVLDNGDGSGWMSAGLPAREGISGALQPEIGFKASFDFTAPAVYGQRIVDLL